MTPVPPSIARSHSISSSDVENPDHYTKGGIETKDYMVAKYGELAWYHYCVLNAQKYLSRFPDKGTPLQDLAKCQQYLKWTVEMLIQNPHFTEIS